MQAGQRKSAIPVHLHHAVTEGNDADIVNQRVNDLWIGAEKSGQPSCPHEEQHGDSRPVDQRKTGTHRHGFTDAVETIRTLKKWGQEVRLLETGPLDRRSINANEMDARYIVGGLLLQQRDLVGWEPDALTYPTKLKPTKEQLEDLRIAWITAKHVKSNTIVLAKNKKVIGVGAGQMNRVTSGMLAVKMAGDESKGACMASDAFFPFTDNVDNAAAAGIACIVQPGGSKKDDEVIAAADKYGIAIVFTGKRHFKH